jgi:hypothetical protein
MVKSRRMRWPGHVAQIGLRAMDDDFWWGCQKARDHLEDQDISGWIILKLILERIEWY